MTTAEIKKAAKACYKAAGAPYSEVPKEVMELAKSVVWKAGYGLQTLGTVACYFARKRKESS